MITRSCTQQLFLLLPTKEVEQIFAYCLAYAQNATGMEIHASRALSNHHHTIVTDVLGKLPKFCEHLHKLVAKCLNTRYGHGENFWAANVKTSYLELPNDEAKIAKVAYAIANPVEAALVRREKNWPGFRALQPSTQKRRRPKVFFSETGPMPEVAKLRITPVPLDSVEREREVMEIVNRAIADRESDMRKKHDADGTKFMGVAAIMKQHYTDSPSSKRPGRSGRISPRVATRNKWRRIEVLQRLKQFAIDHREAMRKWVAGDRDVCFPEGTYKMRLLFGVRCAEAET